MIINDTLMYSFVLGYTVTENLVSDRAKLIQYLYDRKNTLRLKKLAYFTTQLL